MSRLSGMDAGARALIITEKPSVARDITRALGGFKSIAHGVWESKDYLCCHALGHLLELWEPEDYNPELKRWSWQSLPIVPSSFKFKPKAAQKELLETIRQLSGRPDVVSLINACDAAREGELIFNEIVEYIGCFKPTKRLWLQSMTDDAIRGAFTALRPSECLKGLRNAALCRATSDWLVGMNATRAFTMKFARPSEKGVWSAGRVQTPTLSILVKRELEIIDFEPSPYFELFGHFSGPDGVYKGRWFDPKFKKDDQHPERTETRIFEKQIALDLQSNLHAKEGVYADSVRKRTEAAPPLFSLSSLQRMMSSKHQWTAKKTLDVAQSCYETYKVLTYPRTESQALPSSYETVVSELLRNIDEKNFFNLRAAAHEVLTNGIQNKNKIFDDKGVDDHFAIIPTGHGDPRKLPADEVLLLETVYKRFVAACYGEAVYQRKERVTQVEGVHFKTGPDDVLVDAGWKVVFGKKPDSVSSRQTSQLTGTAKVVDLEWEALATKPPPRHSEATLLSAMEHAGRHVEDGDLARILRDTSGLGTAATRADIIENLKGKGYIAPDLRPTPKGVLFVDVLKSIPLERMTSAELTAELERDLMRVEKGELTTAAFGKEVENYIKEVVHQVALCPLDELFFERGVVANCPLCLEQNRSGLVVESLHSFVCQSEGPSRCSFMISKASASDREPHLFVTRKVLLRLIDSGEWKSLKRDPNAGALGGCPVHQACSIVETKNSFLCETRLRLIKEGKQATNGFYAPKVLCHRPLDRDVIAELIRIGRTARIEGFIGRSGQAFSAALKVGGDGSVTFLFS